MHRTALDTVLCMFAAATCLTFTSCLCSSLDLPAMQPATGDPTISAPFALPPGAQMFEMDSYVAVDVLGLSFMKGDQPHAGFPEASYTAMAEQLARAGYRVVVVEQVGGWVGGWVRRGAAWWGCWSRQVGVTGPPLALLQLLRGVLVGKRRCESGHCLSCSFRGMVRGASGVLRLGPTPHCASSALRGPPCELPLQPCASI